jgi:hypothetical protein
VRSPWGDWTKAPAAGGNRVEGKRRDVKITDIEAMVLRQPRLDTRIADGSQDDLVIRMHTG